MKKRYDTKLLVATVGLGLIVVSLISLFVIWGPSAQYYKELSGIELFLVVSGAMGGLILWISVLAHFFQNRDIKHRVLWGFSLIFFSWVAALLYLIIQVSKKLNATHGNQGR
jgi:hypothetical protein